MEQIQDLLAEYYFLLKALHIISVISWMAGLLYLPRLFAYHTTVASTSEASKLFKVMEKRLLKIIMNPAMIATFITGFSLLFVPGMLEKPNAWIHAKLFLVFGLAGAHGFMAKTQKVFGKDKNIRSHNFYRIFNEVPAVIMIFIVFLVVFKSF